MAALMGRHLDEIIGTLRAWTPGARWTVPEADLRRLLYSAREVLLDESSLLDLQAPLNVLGDIHGQYADLLRYFETVGYPPTTRFLLLGDYVDRGKYSVETLTLLLAYKVKYPNYIFLLRGNHESANINQVYGFFDECKRRFTVRLWKCFVDTYNCLPVAAVINDKIFCCHGGLSPMLHDMSDIQNLRRPCEVGVKGLLCDLLWSDPEPSILGWANSPRGASYVFGPDIVSQFLARFGMELICRAHQVVADGYEFFAKRQLITVFSAAGYCGEFDNAGAMMCVDSNLTISFVILKPKTSSKDKD